MRKKSVKRMFLLTVLLGIGLNIHHPVTPTLYTALNLPSRIFGTSMAVMYFFSFITSIFWGEISNHIGRIRTFRIACLFYGFGQLLLSLTSSEMMILCARAISGAFSGGCLVTAMAYTIDVSDSQHRTKNLAIHAALQTSSAGVGYLLGGVLGTISFRLAFNTQALWMFLLSVLAYFYIEDSYADKRAVSASEIIATANPFKSFINARSVMNSLLCLFVVVVFLASFGTTCHENAFNYFLKAELDFKPFYNGIIKALNGAVALTANFTINLWIINHTNIKKSAALILLLCSFTALGALIPGSMALFLGLNVLFFAANAIYQPLMNSLAVEGKEGSQVGIITGLFNAIKSMGNVTGSLMAGLVYGIHTSLPFILSASVFLIAGTVAIIYWRRSEASLNQS